MDLLITGCERLQMETLAAALASFGFQVISASSARDVSSQLSIEAVLLGCDGIVPRVIANIYVCNMCFPAAPIILIGAGHSDTDIVRFVERGARAYIPPDTPLQELINAIRSVIAGEAVCPQWLPALVSTRIAVLAKAERESATIPLTAREQQVLRLIRAGLSNKEIAAALSISSNTVKIHVHRVLEKLHLRRRQDARRSICGIMPGC